MELIKLLISEGYMWLIQFHSFVSERILGVQRYSEGSCKKRDTSGTGKNKVCSMSSCEGDVKR